MARRQVREEPVGGDVSKPKRSSGPKGVSKSRYYTAGPTRIPRNKARRAARVARRKAYWLSAAGMVRKEAKMNTPEKLKKQEVSKVARAARRRERKLAEQKAARENAVANEKKA